MKYTNWDAATKKLGHKQRKALAFAGQDWRSFDKTTEREIESLAKRGLVEINEFGQFRAHPDLMPKYLPR